MKRHAWALTVTILIAVVMSVGWARAAFGFGPYPLNGPRPLTDVTLGQATRGVVFGTAAIPESQLGALVAYVEYLHHPRDRGGLGLGHLGPIPEGFVGWLVGMGLLLLAARLIGTRA